VCWLRDARQGSERKAKQLISLGPRVVDGVSDDFDLRSAPHRSQCSRWWYTTAPMLPRPRTPTGSVYVAYPALQSRAPNTMMALPSACWCSRDSTAADTLLRRCCPLHVHFMFRSPSSLSTPPSAYACNANGRILRPFRAEMAENETIA
jgi:hypothetical protein